jgi:predicted RNA-binding Zn-ribbon protein involved in translation (DUF1610 family)
MHQCPKCKSEHIHRSRVRTTWEGLRKEVTGKRPYRCHECGWRGWSIDLGPKFGDDELEVASRALAPDPPNLKGTDLARDERRDFVDLNQLDALEAFVHKQK